MSALLECRKLTKRYKTKEVLNQVNLTLESGRMIGLLGPNGSGKTTLIKMINGLLTPTEGELLFCGGKIGEQSKRHISYLPDQTYLNMNQKVRDVIAFFEDFYEDFEKERAYDMLKKLQISADDRLKTLSKGTKEKVQLVLVMSRRAKLYVLDEPIAGVDPAVRDYILKTIISNYEPEASVLIATHLIADIENVLDEVVLIQNGRVMQRQMRRLRMSTEDLFEELRRAGVFALEDVAYAIVETNGQMSVLKRAPADALTPKQAGVKAPPEALEVVVVSDGRISENSLKLCGRDPAWLRDQLRCQGAALEDVFIMTVRTDGGQRIIRKQTDEGT